MPNIYYNPPYVTDAEAAGSGSSALPVDRLWLFANSPTSILTTADTIVVLDTVDDPPGIVGTSLSTDGTGIVIGENGTYSFTGSVAFAGTVSADGPPGNQRRAQLEISGGGDEPPEGIKVELPANGPFVQTVIMVSINAISLIAGQTVRLKGYQQSGETLDTYGWLYGRRLG